METHVIIDLMLKSSDTCPYNGMLSKRGNYMAAIELAELFHKFAINGDNESACNINASEWKVVVSQLNLELTLA
jgi:hypothetical protein